MSTTVKTYFKPAGFKVTVDAGDVSSGLVQIQTVDSGSTLADNVLLSQIKVADADGVVQAFDGAITYESGVITITDEGTYTFVSGHEINLMTMLA